MNSPVWVERAEIERLRSGRLDGAIFKGLWVCGDLNGLKRTTIAIVGTRAASGYGRNAARRFAADFGAAGCTILSGLALGIDAAAHEGALEAGAATIGVLGGGHAEFFPRRNRSLAERMLQNGGAVISPYPPAQPAFPSQFLQRNGIVAALADAVIVIEAPARSGALNTASWAAGRIPVFAVPGDIDRTNVAGCHALIRDGAILARSAQDVILDLGLQPATARELQCESRQPADPVQATVLEALRAGERSLDELCAECATGTAAVLTAISLLELQGRIETRAGLRYALR